MDRAKFIGGSEIRSAPTAVARMETMAGRFSVSVQILLDTFFSRSQVTAFASFSAPMGITAI
jgi:hypothetical protein